MLTVKAPKIEFTMPSAWEEVTLRQFLNLYATRTLNSEGFAEYSISTTLRCLASDVKQLEQLGDYEEAQIVNRIPYIKKHPDFAQLDRPISWQGKPLLKDIGTGTLLQKWTIEQVMRERLEEQQDVDFISIAVETLCIYLYPILAGAPLTDADQVSEVLEQVEALPVTIALPLSTFFLAKLRNPTPTGETDFYLSSPKPQPKSRRPRWFPNWKAMRNWVRFGRSPSGDVLVMKKSSS